MTNIKVMSNNADSLAASLRFAQAAAEYLAARKNVKAEKSDLRRRIGEFLSEGGYEPDEFVDAAYTDEFQEEFSGMYSNLKASKKIQYNADRRMMTAFRKLSLMEVA